MFLNLFIRKFSFVGVISVFVTSAFSLSAQTQNPTTSPTPPIPGKGVASEQSKLQGIQLGISVSKPGDAVYAQLPKLPRGSGFLLQSVTVGGTADVAGLKPMDVIWKLDDQLLINESQLMILLSHHRIGDKVTISYFHSGLEKKATLVFQAGNTPVAQHGNAALNQPFPGALRGVDFPALPMRVISYEDRSASISDNNGTATLTFREGKQWLHVESTQGVETYNGPVAGSDDIARVPLAWRGRLPILQRSLEESIRLRRLPRVRRVPSPKQRIAGGE